MAKKTQKRKTNPWLVHLMKEKEKNPTKKFSEVMKIAKKSYKPIKK